MNHKLTQLESSPNPCILSGVQDRRRLPGARLRRDPGGEAEEAEEVPGGREEGQRQVLRIRK